MMKLEQALVEKIKTTRKENMALLSECSVLITKELEAARTGIHTSTHHIRGKLQNVDENQTRIDTLGQVIGTLKRLLPDEATA